MRILLTNDDGIAAPGLAALEAIAREIAGPEGEVWTVAPAFEQSGVGHCISYTHPTLFDELAPRRWAIEGSPADCVLAAVHEITQTAFTRTDNALVPYNAPLTSTSPTLPIFDLIDNCGVDINS